jgi:hypothetical protein
MKKYPRAENAYNLPKIAILSLIISTSAMDRAHAETYGLHLASYHTAHGNNNVNPGLYVRTDGDLSVQAGAYHNSLRRATVYGMANASLGAVTVSLGAATGYRRDVVPMVALSYRVGHWRLAYVPKFGELNKGHVFHSTYEF